jgi:hypothetical protein
MIIQKDKIFIGIPVFNEFLIELSNTIYNISVNNKSVDIIICIIDDNSTNDISKYYQYFSALLTCENHKFVFYKNSVNLGVGQTRDKIIEKFLESDCNYFCSLDATTYVGKNVFIKCINILQNTMYNFVAPEYLRMHKTWTEKYGKNYNNIITFSKLHSGANFIFFERKVFESGIKYELRTREDTHLIASAINKNFFGCDVKLKVKVQRKKRQILKFLQLPDYDEMSPFSQSNINACKFISEKFSFIKYINTGKLKLNLPKSIIEKMKTYQYDDINNSIVEIKEK